MHGSPVKRPSIGTPLPKDATGLDLADHDSLSSGSPGLASCRPFPVLNSGRHGF